MKGKDDHKYDGIMKMHPIETFDQESCELIFQDGARKLMDGPALIISPYYLVVYSLSILLGVYRL